VQRRHRRVPEAFLVELEAVGAVASELRADDDRRDVAITPFVDPDRIDIAMPRALVAVESAKPGL
jgi:hypothetical protein